jgi:hypothetical protein
MYLVSWIGQPGCASIVKATWPKSALWTTLYECGQEVSSALSVPHVRVKRHGAHLVVEDLGELVD